MQLEIDAARIDGYGSETFCVSIGFFPTVLSKELEEFYEKLKDYSESVADILLAILGGRPWVSPL